MRADVVKRFAWRVRKVERGERRRVPSCARRKWPEQYRKCAVRVDVNSRDMGLASKLVAMGAHRVANIPAMPLDLHQPVIHSSRACPDSLPQESVGTVVASKDGSYGPAAVVVIVGTVGADVELVATQYQDGHTQGQGHRRKRMQLDISPNCFKMKANRDCLKGGYDLFLPADRASILSFARLAILDARHVRIRDW